MLPIENLRTTLAKKGKWRTGLQILHLSFYQFQAAHVTSGYKYIALGLNHKRSLNINIHKQTF